MDKIKFSLFDVFAYIFPGLLMLLAMVSLLNTSILQPFDIIAIIQKIDINVMLVSLILSYILGFAIDTPGSYLYNFIANKFWSNAHKDYSKLNDGLSNTEKRILVRQFSPENYEHIHLWKIIKTMSHNLSCSSLIVGGVGIIKLFQTQNRTSWVIIILISFGLSFVFMHRAYIFDSWHYKQLAYIVKVLNLKERAVNDVKK